MLRHQYSPRGTSREIFGIRVDEVLVSGPAGTGKSRGCLEKLHMAMSNTEHARGLIVRKTATSLTSTALVTYREWVAKEQIESGHVSFYSGSAESPPGYRYSNGSFIALGGMDKPSKIMSSEYDMAYIQEATELNVDDWEAITTRLRNGRLSFQQALADCNPSFPKHWLKHRFDERNEMRRILYSTHRENPRYYDELGEITPQGESYLGKLRNLTGVRKARLLDGLWVAAEGIIFEEWDDQVHLINRTRHINGRDVEFEEYAKDWTRIWVADFGVRHPFVLQAWAVDPEDGAIYMYRTLHMTERSPEDHIKQWMRACTTPTGRVDDDKLDKHPEGPLHDIGRGWRKWIEPKPWFFVTDHQVESRMIMEKYSGMSTEPATKDVTEGIDHTKIRLRAREGGRAGLYVLRDSLLETDLSLKDAGKPTWLAEEIPGYVWAPDPTGGTRKEVPVKVDDDGCDCMRYVVAALDMGPGQPNVRWMS